MELGAVIAWIFALSVEAKLALLTMVGGSTLAAAKGGIYLWSKGKAITRVQRLSGKREDDILAFVDLYERIIDVRSRIDPEEMLSWVRGRIGVEGLSHDTLVCKLSGELVGFAQIMFCKEHRFGFISYFGIDEEKAGAIRTSARALSNALSKHIRKHCRSVRYVLFEVDDPNELGIPDAEVSRRKARIRRFRSLAATCGLTVGEVCVPYTQPEMPTDIKKSNECQMRLLLIGSSTRPVPNSIAKSELMDVVRFIYYRIYLPSYYKGEGRLTGMYVDYLYGLLTRLDKQASSRIPVR